MTELEAIARLKASRFLVEAVVRPRTGYMIFDQVDRPLEILGRSEFPDVGTAIWQDGEEWIWEYHLVVPGPGPKRRYRSLAALIDELLREYRACRAEAEGNKV